MRMDAAGRVAGVRWTGVRWLRTGIIAEGRVVVVLVAEGWYWLVINRAHWMT